MNQFGKLSELKIIVAKNSKGKTFIKDSFFTSPFKIMKPFERNDGGITVFQQTASAGIMAGDEQEHKFTIKKGATLEIVSQSFEKIFKMDDKNFAQRKIFAKVEQNGTFIFSPLPCIPFAGSDFSNYTKIYLSDSSSRLIYKDCISAGRIASGELFDFRKYHNLVEIFSEKKLIYRDNSYFLGSDCENMPKNKEKLKSPCAFGSYSHLGSMIIFNYNIPILDIQKKLGIEEKLLYTKENIENQKKKSSALIGVTKTEENGIAIKVLANSAEEVQNIFEKVRKIC